VPVGCRTARARQSGAHGEREQVEAASRGTSASDHALLRLQGAVGNRAVTQLLASTGASTVHPLMKVGRVEDPEERAADRSAAVALRALGLGGAAPHAPGSDAVGGSDLHPSVARQLSTPAGGAPLPEGTRSQMEGAFGRSFGDVVVHHDDRAHRLAAGMQARAFAAGNHLFFGRGEYDPGTAQGQQVLAHELAHVVQRQTGGQPQVVRRLFQPTVVADIKEGDLEPREEEIPHEFISLADHLQGMRHAFERHKDFDLDGDTFANEGWGQIGANGAGAFSEGVGVIAGGADVVKGAMRIKRGTAEQRALGLGPSSFDKNLGAKQVEGGLLTVATGGTGVAGSIIQAAGKNMPGVDVAYNYAQAAVKGKEAIEETATAARLANQKKHIKRDRDRLLPEEVRLERFRQFQALYLPWKQAGQEIEQLEKDLPLLEAQLEQANAQAATAGKALSRSTSAFEAATKKLEKAEKEHQRKTAAGKGSGSGASALATAQGVAQAQTAKQQQPAAGQQPAASVAQSLAASSSTPALPSDLLARRAKKIDTEDQKDQAQRADTDARRRAREANERVQAAKRRLTAAKAQRKEAESKTKSGEFRRYEELRAKYTRFDPMTGGDHAVLLFLDWCAEQGEKELHYGTELRKQYQQSLAAPGAAAASDEYKMMQDVDAFRSFGHRRKAEMATVHSVQAAGYALDGTGTLTAGADMGITKGTGKLLKAGTAMYTGSKRLVKRARRVHKLRTTRNAIGYGDTAQEHKKRGVGWGTRQFFGGNVEASMKKTMVSAKDAEKGTHHAAKQSRILADIADPAERAKKAKEVTARMKTQATRQIGAFIDALCCPGNTTQAKVVRDRAEKILHIIAETSVVGQMAKISKEDIEELRRLAAEAEGKPKGSGAQRMYKARVKPLKELLKKQLEGIGG
jgi:hypothetical protein